MLPRARTWPDAMFEKRGSHSRIAPMNGGDGSIVDLDFTLGAIPSGATFARAGIGTYMSSSGLLVSAGSGVPRFGYDSAGAILGLHMEGQQVNYLCHSEGFLTSTGTNQWVDGGAGPFIRVSTNNTAPDGTATALRVQVDELGNSTCISNLSRTPDADSCGATFSVWLRRVSGSGSIQLTDNNGTNWTTVAVSTTWTRFALPYRATAQQCGVRGVSPFDTFEMWGAQLEDGSGASTYIKTTTAAATRVQDSLIHNDPAYALIDPTRCTILLDLTLTNEHGGRVSGGGSETNNFIGIVSFCKVNSSGYRAELTYNNGLLTSPRLIALLHNASAASITGNALVNRTALARSIIAFSIAGSGVNPTRLASIGGASGTGSTLGSNGPVGSMDHLRINASGYSAGADDYPSYILRRVKVWNEAYTQAQLNALTAAA